MIHIKVFKQVTSLIFDCVLDYLLVYWIYYFILIYYLSIGLLYSREKLLRRTRGGNIVSVGEDGQVFV